MSQVKIIKPEDVDGEYEGLRTERTRLQGREADLIKKGQDLQNSNRHDDDGSIRRDLREVQDRLQYTAPTFIEAKRRARKVAGEQLLANKAYRRLLPRGLGWTA